MFCRHRINHFINYKNCVNIVTNKHFHLSHLNQVRKPSSSRRTLGCSFEDVQEQTVSGVFHNAPKNAHTNFYGVESDEGVINVEEIGKSGNSNQRLQKVFSYQPMNGFRSYNFGAVRLDNENKPSFYVHSPIVKHKKNDIKRLNSQEKNIEQFKKDQSTVENLEVNNRHLNQNIIITEDPNSLSSEKNNFSNYQNIKKDKTDNFKSSKDSHVTSPYKENQFAAIDSNVSESYVDKYYFSENNSENVTPRIGKSIVNFTKTQKFREKNRNTSDILPETNVHNIKKDTVDSFQSDNLQSEDTHVHNIKKDTVDSFQSDNLQSEDTHVIDSHKQSQFDLSKISESFIDKHYFTDNYMENSIPQIEKHSDDIIEEQYFKESYINASKTDYETVSVSETNKYYPNKNLAESFVPINENSGINYKNVFESHQNMKENKSCNYENDIRFNHNMSIPDPTKNVDDLTSSEISTVSYEKNKQQRDNSQKKSNKSKILTMKVGLTKENKKDFQVHSQTENPNKEVNSESTNSPEKVQEKEPSVENKIETAFDFVKALKGNNLLSDDVKKGISAKKEKKVDSKGFRILKHQVPSLKYFTKDEMLELLEGNILYKDEDIVVLNKPYNLVIHESSTSQDMACLSKYLDDLAKLLDRTTNSPKLITVHRIDKETTGCLLLARNELLATRLKSLFAQRKIVKTYWIVTSKVPDPMDGIIDMPISEGKIENKSRMVLHPNLPNEIPYVSHSKAGKQAITQYSVIAVSGNAALVEVKPETGIKHQIRVHFGFGLGCPILGDHKYSYLDKLVPQKLSSDLLQKLQVRQSKVRHIPLHIHSKHIFIPQYSNGRNLFVSAPLPKHISENLKFLKFKKK